MNKIDVVLNKNDQNIWFLEFRNFENVVLCENEKNIFAENFKIVQKILFWIVLLQNSSNLFTFSAFLNFFLVFYFSCLGEGADALLLGDLDLSVGESGETLADVGIAGT